jgi:putative flavoprotein involved in K+ transport
MNEDVVEATATFETEVARCHAVIRLKDGKCWTFLTAATELKGFEKYCGARRPQGAPTHYRPGRKSWGRQRERDGQEIGTTREPYCVIVGAGHCGLALAAHLKQLGVPTLVIDKRVRPSDTWRDRYDSLSLHSPSWYDQLPSLAYPETWPLFPSKDQFANWLDAYATVMELDIWPETEFLLADFNEVRGEWRIEVVRGGHPVSLRPKHLVFATGLLGAPKIPDLPGNGRFRGAQCHASSLRTGNNCEGRNFVVIGAGTTAHDICAELWEAGAGVTMIQRGPTIVMRQERVLAGIADLYGDEVRAAGMTAKIADLLFASLPYRVLLQMQQRVVAQVKEQDALFYAQLRKAGFLVTLGEEEAGILPQILRNPSGYYMDVGASELVINGQIRVRSGVGVKALGESAVILTDGTEIAADVVVYATGFDGAPALGMLPEDIACKVGRIWGLGSGLRNDPGPWEGELRNMWKPTAQTGLWFHSHGVGGSRFYSGILALQIKGRHAGLQTPVYRGPAIRGSDFLG